MIFDADGSSSYGNDSYVKESRYELGLKGALMHVYENECNYNAMMKSIGLSELKYYKETGEDLFVNEAGAFSGMLDKVKKFFKAVIEKIKSIFHKFMAKINSYTMEDKKFVKKYKTEILRKNVTDLEFTGYEKFKDKVINIPINNINYYSDTDLRTSGSINRGELNNNYKSTTTDFTSTTNKDNYYAKYADQDAVNDECEKKRGAIYNGEGSAGNMTEEEFRDGLKETLYGDKETFDVTPTIVRNALTTIENTNDAIKKAKKAQDNITKNIDNLIRNLDNYQKEVDKEFSEKNKNGKTADNTDIAMANRKTQNISDEITIWKSMSNDYTVAYGMYVQALKDANRQAKALCVKVISYNKKESANYESASYANDDIFSDVKFV
jgi:hypothetical protein